MEGGEGDFLEGSFSFKRAAWDTTWNDLSGKFTDAGQDFSERAVTASNAASIQLLGLRRKKSVDLTAFTDRAAAQRRIEELRDVESYPAASFSFDLSRDHVGVEQGQILEITHARFGLSGVRVRVLEVARGNLTENRISVQARQVVERLSGTFVPPGEPLPDPLAPPETAYPPVGGIPSWTPPDLTPEPLRHARLFELPRNPETGGESAVLVLAARERLTEDGLLVERSSTGTDYAVAAALSAPWAQYGTLAEAYPADTLEVDDERGLLYLPYKEDPAFGPVSRTELFEARRMALIDDELLLFQTVVLEGQAVALHTEGDRLKFINCRILGNQDTIYTGAKFTRLYFKDCYIDGTTDFIFGPSTALFEDCIIHSKRNSYVTAASTPKEAKYGYVFKHCKLTAEPGVDKVYLGRPWRPYAYTLFIECELGKHIVLAGWHNWGKQSNEETARYMEYKNTGEGANASERVAWSKQLTKKEAEAVTVDAIFRTQSDWDPID